jgi:hypothetical protein
MWYLTKCSKDGKTDIINQSYSSQLWTGSMVFKKQNVYVLIKYDRTVMAKETASWLPIGHIFMQKMILTLGYQEVFCCWAPCLLNVKVASLDFERYATAGNDFILDMTSNKSWFHHFKSKTNCTARNCITSQLQRRQRLEQWDQLVKFLEMCSGISRDACLHGKPSLCSHTPDTNKHCVTTAWWRKTSSLNTTMLYLKLHVCHWRKLKSTAGKY